MTERRFGPRSFEVGHEDKPLFPGGGPTKGQIIDYYAKIAPAMLPHLRDRPLVMKRCPDGIEEGCFYQKQIGSHFPGWIDRVSVPRKSGGRQTLVVAGNAATLAYLASQAVIPVHAWLSRRDDLDRPDQLIVDLDPPGRDFSAVLEAARQCRDLLDDLGLPSFVKTTGSRGLHVVVPLDRSSTFDEVRRFARDAMQRLAARHPGELTVEVRKSKRRGRLYLDVGRNAYAQTAVAPYAVRALPGAPVATPLDWNELSRADMGARSWHIGNIFRRLGQRADPWRQIRRKAVSLKTAWARLEQMKNDGPA